MTALTPEVPLHKNSAFLSLWSLGALNSTGRWLETLVVAIFVFDQTASPFLVALMLVLRLLPMSLFGLFGGIIAQRLERFVILKFASAVITLVTFFIYLLAAEGLLTIWHVGGASFISGLVWSTDFPVRRTLMGDLAGPARISRAMSLDILAGSGTRLLGPLLGGVLYQQIGIHGAFLLSTSLYLAGFVLILVTPYVPDQISETQQSMTEDLAAGWRVLKRNEFLPGLLIVTVIFNIWGFPFMSMVPVLGKEHLGLNDAATGLLASAEGAGALIAAIALSIFARSRHARIYFSLAVLTYCLFALLFTLSNVIWLSGLLLLAVGFVSAAFAAMQSALVLMNSPEKYQRQMMGVLAVCIGTAPIGFLHIGYLAELLGATTACLVAAIEGMIAMLFAFWRWPNLLHTQPVE